MSDSERTAFHEAGHATAAVALGLSVPRVTVERSTVIQRGTWERYAGLTELSSSEDAVSFAIVCFAGPAASARYCPGDTTDMESDFRAAEEAIDAAVRRELPSRPTLSTYARRRAVIAMYVKSHAERLVADHWIEIRAMANALLACRTLAGDAVLRIFERSLRERGAQ